MVVTFPLSTSPTSRSAEVIITTLPSDAAAWAYSVNGGSTWIVQTRTDTSFVLIDGTYEVNAVRVRCVDALGNLSVNVTNSSLILIDYYNGYLPSIVIPPGADPSEPVVVATISSLDLTNTAIIGTTQAAQQKFTTNAMKSLFNANTTQSQLVLPPGSILPGYTVSVTEPIYLFKASLEGAALTHDNIMGKTFYILLEDGDQVTMQTNIDVVTIVKVGEIFTITSKVSVTTAVVGDTYEYDGLNVILGSVVGNLVATTVNFVLTALDSQIMSSISAMIPNYTPSPLTSDATISLTTPVPASVLQNTFFYRADNPIAMDASFVYYYVDVTKWPNASTELSARNGIVTTHAYVANDTLGKDFLRDLARQLFGTYLGADLFTNEDVVVGNINSGCDQVANTIVTLLTSIDKTNGVINGISTDASGNKYLNDNFFSTSNISRELFNQLMTVAPGRFQNIHTNYRYNATDDGYYKMPIIAGDTIAFKITVAPASGQMSSVPTTQSELSSRTYTVVLTVS
jgi:hypothetical protein